jgi:hypothetical protein
VIDGDPTRPGQHFYGVTDSQQAVFSDNGRRYTAWNYLHLTADSTELDFLHGEGLVQDFSLTQRPDVIAGGAIQFGRTWIDDLQSGIQGVMGFALTRLTVRPGRCSIEHD